MTTFYLNEKTVRDAAMIANEYLENTEKMNTQMIAATDGTYVIQARAKGGKLKQWAGLDKVVTVRLKNVNNEYVNVEIGSGKWIDKGIAMTVSMFVLWPLAVTSGYGMYKQGTLPGKIARAIEAGLNN